MKHKPKTITLSRTERIVAVVPERCSGPGWGNSPAWVHILDRDGKYREECIRPEDRTDDMEALFAAGLEMCRALVSAVPTKVVE